MFLNATAAPSPSLDSRLDGEWVTEPQRNNQAPQYNWTIFITIKTESVFIYIFPFTLYENLNSFSSTIFLSCFLRIGKESNVTNYREIKTHVDRMWAGCLLDQSAVSGIS